MTTKMILYLDDEFVVSEHLCCLAHARAKFKYAYEQWGEQARFFLIKMGMLYRLEESYRKDDLTPLQIQTRRNDAETESIIESIRNEMFDLLVQSKKL